MSDKSKIEWTDATWNPWVGCTRVSEGCRHCYAQRIANRLQAMHVRGYEGVLEEHGRWSGRVNVIESALELPKRWTRPRKIFVNSMSDLFHENIPLTEVYRVLEVIRDCPQHQFQVLTKRPERMRDAMQVWAEDLPNLWLGVSVENAAAAEERIPVLLDVVNVGIRFLSVEPLLEWFDLLPGLHLIDWVIFGCESGPQRRDSQREAMRDMITCCVAESVPCFVKQIEIEGRVSKNPADHWPPGFCKREFPAVCFPKDVFHGSH